MTIFAEFSATEYENAVADALADENLPAVKGLLKQMAVHHPHQCLTLLDGIQSTLDALYAKRVQSPEVPT